MRSMNDIRRLHTRALDSAGELVARVRSADLANPTACADWDLLALLTHAIGQNRGFAAAVQDGDAPATAYTLPPPPADSLAAEWTRSAQRLTEAISGAPREARVRLVEFGPDAVFPVDTVVGFHLLDTTVHAWDIASGLGQSYRPDDELVEATAVIATQVPAGDARTRPGAAFTAALPGDDDDPWIRALAWLGRSAT